MDRSLSPRLPTGSKAEAHVLALSLQEVLDSILRSLAPTKLASNLKQIRVILISERLAIPRIADGEKADGVPLSPANVTQLQQLIGGRALIGSSTGLGERSVLNLAAAGFSSLNPMARQVVALTRVFPDKAVLGRNRKRPTKLWQG